MVEAFVAGGGSCIQGRVPQYGRATAAVGCRHPSQVTIGRWMNYPASCLMRAIISSVACSGFTLSLTTRWIALAQTFSEFTMVNL